MKSLFPGYAQPNSSELDKLWEQGTLIIFDTSSLLNLYRYKPAHSKKFLDFLGKLSERIWLPHQVGLEFHRNREKVIADQGNAYKKLASDIRKHNDLINQAKNKILEQIKSQVEQRHPYIDADEIRKLVNDRFEQFTKLFDEVDAYLEQVQKDLPESAPKLKADPIYENLVELFTTNNTGQSYTQEQSLQIYESGVIRYKNSIPPGYLDGDKTGYLRYGDLVLWHQIVDKARETSQPVFLVIDDAKEDWWENPGTTTARPRPELVQELYETTGVPFCMFTSISFLEFIEPYLGEEIEQEVKEDVRAVQEFDEQQKATAPLIVGGKDFFSSTTHQTPNLYTRVTPNILDGSLVIRADQIGHSLGIGIRPEIVTPNIAAGISASSLWDTSLQIPASQLIQSLDAAASLGKVVSNVLDSPSLKQFNESIHSLGSAIRLENVISRFESITDSLTKPATIFSEATAVNPVLSISSDPYRLSKPLEQQHNILSTDTGLETKPTLSPREQSSKKDDTQNESKGV